MKLDPSLPDGGTTKDALGFALRMLTSLVYSVDPPSLSRTVKLTVRDKDGGSTEYTSEVSILNANPSASFVVPPSGSEGSSFILSLVAGTDPSPVDATSLTYAFDCGNGYG